MYILLLFVLSSVDPGYPRRIDETAPPCVRDAVPSVVSLLPQRVVGEPVSGGFVKVQGLKPATGFHIGNGLIVTAGHTASQSAIALARPVDLKGSFLGKLQCQGIHMTYGNTARVVIKEYRITGEYLKDTELTYDVGCYRIESGTETCSALKVSSNVPAEGRSIFLIGVVFADNRYHLKYSAGTIAKVLQSTSDPRLILLNAESGPGFSGGPVIDSQTGQVLGVVTGGYEFSPHRYTVAWSLPPER